MLRTTGVLQKEQTDLYAIERKLVKTLPLVQEALNVLKVEELHLQSQSVLQTMSKEPNLPSVEMNISNSCPTQSNITFNEQINQQQINLGLLSSNFNQYDVEIDSE